MFISSLFKVKKGDVLLVVTNPPTLPIFMLITCRIKGAKCIIKVDDTYPDVLSACDVLSQKSLAYRLLNRIYKWVYKAADDIIVVGRDMRDRLIEKIGERPNINVITHWADIDIIQPDERKNNPLLTELNLHNKFIVLWAGNMGFPHEVNTLFDGINKLSCDDRIHFLFIGSGAKRPAFEAKIRNEGLKNVTFTGVKPRSEQQVFLNACDIGITAIISGLTGVSVPSRSYNIFAAGKPILAIADPGGEISQVIEENKLGWVINPGDSDGLSSAILSALETPSILDDIRISARKLVETKYSRSHIISRYVKIINQCALR